MSNHPGGPRNGDSASGAPSTERVRTIFARIATSYDLVNLVASMGVDRSWRRACVREARVAPGDDVLDLAGGTGDLALAAVRHAEPATVTSTDFVPEMLEIARAKAARTGTSDRLVFAIADAQDLPFEDESFDVVTIGFGLRNLPDRHANMREVVRVLRPGGRYAILEFSRPSWAPWRALYYAYLRSIVPFLGGLLSGDRSAYRYLNDSIRAFPDQRELAEELASAGFQGVEWRNLTGGVVAVHVALKPLESAT